MNKDKLILPVTILLAAIIIGGFIYASQTAKQQSIERQQRIELEAKQAELQAEKEQQDKIKQEEELKQLNLSYCLEKADEAYLSYLKLNGTTNKDGSVTTPTYISDIANKNKQNDKDNCYKQYK